ncbi:histidine kinase [Dyadobacter beijingensis]|uniref:Histidine kinase n=1 Tax=Dyadobacter beijingensis TaxID=365489 RepID=A0ABQ2IKW0_9BACT|nr:histidine kinase [Dyadobacter beijingensis]GGN11786.1 histidine kinase [Dyadobacter beijingensis]
MTRENTKGGVVVAIHLLAWALLGFVLVFYQPLSWGVSLPVVFWVKQLLNFGLLVALFYFNSLYLVPRYLLSNRIVAFILWVIALVILMLVISKMADQQLEIRRHMEGIMPRPRHRGGPKPKHIIDGILLMTTLLVIGVSTSLAVIQRWQSDARLRDAVEKQNISSELALLKAQINPHFFFNTLNNIYALSYTNVEESREATLTLSRMMRYLLYETQQDIAPLSQEFAFIDDYIELMKLRVQSSSNVQYTRDEAIPDYPIAPMLLLPFVENAFKHGIDASQRSEIKIHAALDGGALKLTVSNHIFQAQHVEGTDKGGIGLANTRRRLDLLYPQKHHLDIHTDELANTYTVNLIINLT